MSIHQLFADSIKVRCWRREFEKELEQYSLKYSDFEVLYVLRNGEQCQPKQISIALNTEPASISRVLKLLSHKHLITYACDVEDRRRVCVGLSDNGKKLLKPLLND